MTDSDPNHRTVKKNGKDQSQDREIRELRNAVLRYTQDNEAQHSSIINKLHDYETEMKVRNALLAERDKTEGRLRKQVFALSMGFLTLVASLVAWTAVEFRDLHRDVADNTAHFKEFQAIGIEWGEAIDERAAAMRSIMDTHVQALQEDLRQLRRLVNEHQRNKQEHAR